MTLIDFCSWLQDRPFSIAIAESAWMFPMIETVHVIGLTLVFGSIAMLDLRLLGLARKNSAVTEVSHDVLALTWCAFVVTAISGVLMFCSAATRYFENTPFRFKIALLVIAGLNMAIFHLFAFRSVRKWDDAIPPPRSARVAGSVSLLSWLGVIFFGRWIGFV